MFYVRRILDVVHNETPTVLTNIYQCAYRPFFCSEKTSGGATAELGNGATGEAGRGAATQVESGAAAQDRVAPPARDRSWLNQCSSEQPRRHTCRRFLQIIYRVDARSSSS